MSVLKGMSPEALSGLFRSSPRLTSRILKDIVGFDPGQKDRGTAALLAFSGFVFQGLDPLHYSHAQWAYAQEHLLILSGLYGVLRPLDRIQPHRLDLEDPLRIEGQSLYQYWSELVNAYIEKHISKHKILLNMASQEYARLIDWDRFPHSVHIHFKDYKDNSYKVLGTYAKQARGWLLQYIIEHQITEADQIRRFSQEGYSYNESLSDSANLVFTRK